MTSQKRGIRDGVRRLFRLPIRRRDVATADADEELDSFLAERIEDLTRLGMSAQDARAEALRRLGGPLDEVRTALRKSSQQREARLGLRDRLDDFTLDARYVVRGLAHRPGFTTTAMLCLAIGIGANTTMFGVVDALLLRPPAGVRDPGSLFWIGAKRTTPFGGFDEVSGVSYPDYVDFSRSSALVGAAGYNEEERSVGRGTDIQEVHVLTVTHQFMPLLGVRPTAGRFFVPNEDLPGAPPVVVLGNAFRDRLFRPDVDPLGKTVRLGTTLYTIVGVTPRGFNGVGRTNIDLYVPLSSGFRDDSPLDERFLSERGGNWLTVIARAKPDANAERLRAELQTLYQNAHPKDRLETRILVASPTSTVAMTIPRQAQNAAISVWLAGVAAIVLLIACANVACLLLVRATRRRREIAVRLALGVSRARLSRLLISEALILAAGGAIGGLLLARAGESVLRATLLADVALPPSVLDIRVLGITVAAAVMTGVLCGLAPAAVALRAAIGAALRTGERDSADGRGKTLGALLVAQVALTLVLLAGTGLFVRSVRNLQTLDLGFDVEHLLRARVGGGGFGRNTPQSFFPDLLDRVRALPGVERATLATGGPFGNEWMVPLRVPGRAVEAGMPPTFAAVDPDFFATLGMTLERGRLFNGADGASAAQVAVVNDAMARHYWDGDAIGRCMKIGGDTMPCTTVVGVVRNTRQGNITQQSIQNERTAMSYYVLLDHTRGDRAAMLYVRTRGGAARLVPNVRRLMETLAPDLPYPDVTAFSTALEPQFRPWRLGATMFGIFGAIAMVLAIVGLYGVLAFRVGQRTHEIGVRVALGAQRGDVHRLILSQGLRLAALGVVFGIVVALAAGRAINALLYGVSGRDPLVLTITSAALLAVSLLASYLPSRRATRIDPLEALREL